MTTDNLNYYTYKLVANMLEKDSSSLTIKFENKSYSYILDRQTNTITTIDKDKNEDYKMTHIINIPSKEQLEGSIYNDNRSRHFIELKAIVLGFIMLTTSLSQLRKEAVFEIQ